MKLSKYINKYDYIDYYTKPKGLWFFSNIEIQSALDANIKKFKKNNNLEKEINFDEDLSELYDEDESDNEDFNFYELYKKNLLVNESLDKNNHLFIQGNIIDQKSREYIISFFNQINCHVDIEKEYKTKDNSKLFEITKNILKEKESVILFQSVFIFEDKVIKPDAIVKTKDNKIFLIETKATTSAKLVHFLDIFFQVNVLENQKYFIENNFVFEYGLCLIKYEYLNKNNITFEITFCINLKKNVSINTSHKIFLSLSKFESVDFKNKLKKGNSWLNMDLLPINIKKICYQDFKEIDENIEILKNTKYGHLTLKSIDKSKSLILKITNEFNDVIKALIFHKSSLNKNSFPIFYPDKNDKNPIKNSDFFNETKKLYSLMGYKLFDFSGNVADQTEKIIEKIKIESTLEDFLKRPNKNPNVYLKLFNDIKKIKINFKKCDFFLNLLKQKKVYFDFETISTPIRVIDNSLPFMQVITQCSIIKFDELKNNFDDLECNNLIVDPKKINIDWFKKNVDEIFYNDSYLGNSDLENSVSYIVYNKAFEISRLKEIKSIINEKKYTDKINSICNNIFDLADFFKLKGSDSNDPYVLFFKELGGFYSIKKVLPLILKYSPWLFEKTKCLNYEELEVKNGLICQAETIKRFFNLINDIDWINVSNNMKIYCENDVRAMIAIEFFIKDIVKNSKNYDF